MEEFRFSDLPSLQSLVSLGSIERCHKIALVWDDGSIPLYITYDNLSVRVSKFAGFLQMKCPGYRMIGILSRSSNDLPAAVLSVLNGGGAFVALTPEKLLSPANDTIRRLMYMLVHAECLEEFNEYILRNSCGPYSVDFQPLIWGFVLMKHTLNEEALPLYRSLKFKYKDSGITSTAKLAYTVFTSGTTRQPVSVSVPHCCIVPNIIDLTEQFSISSSDVVFNAAPFTFDPAIVELFLALSTGATFLMVPRQLKTSPEALARILLFNSASVLQITPSLAYMLGDGVMSSQILCKDSRVRVLAFGGEACPSLEKLVTWKHSKNTTRLFNIYGITEVSSWASCCEIHAEHLQLETTGCHGNRIPLGEPLMNTIIRVIDDNGHQVTSDQPGEGEIWLGGPGRVCFLGGEEEVAMDTFRATGDMGVMKSNGDVYYVGRKDKQIKRLGHRLNIEGLEQTIRGILTPRHVDSCSLVYIPLERYSLFGEQRGDEMVPVATNVQLGSDDTGVLALFVKMLSGSSRSKDILSLLQGTLSTEMVPDAIIEVDQFPLTSHGKVDNSQLTLSWLEYKRNKVKPILRSVSELRTFLQNIVKTHFDVKWDLNQKLVLDCGLDSFQVLKLHNILLDVLCLPYHTEERNTSSLIDDLLNKDLKTLTCDLLMSEAEPVSSLQTASTLQQYKQLQGTQDEGVMVMDASSANKVSAIEVDTKTADKSSSSSFLSGEPNAKKLKACGKCCVMPSEDTSARLLSCCDNVLHSFRRGQYFCGSEQMVPLLKGDCYIAAFSLRVKWSFNTGKCVDASPLLVVLDEGGIQHSSVCIGSHSGLIVCLKWESGSPIWQTELPDRIESSPVLSKCGSFITTGCYDGCLYVLLLSSGQMYWKCVIGKEPIKSSPCIDALTGYVWVGSHDHHMYALDIKNKKVQFKVFSKGGSYFSSPCINSQSRTVYIGTLGARMLAVDADTGDVKWTMSCSSPIFSSPSLFSNGHVVFGCVDGNLYHVSDTGKLVSTVQTSQPVFSSCCVVHSSDEVNNTSKEFVIFGSHDCKVYCYKRARYPLSHDPDQSQDKLEVVWSFSSDAAFYSTPFTFQLQGALCVCCINIRGSLYCLRLTNGHLVASLQLPGDVFSSPVMWNGQIVVGCRDDHVYGIDIITTA